MRFELGCVDEPCGTCPVGHFGPLLSRFQWLLLRIWCMCLMDLYDTCDLVRMGTVREWDTNN